MKNFAYARATDSASALALLAAGAGSAKLLGGGTNLIDLMRENIERPNQVIDITRLPLTRIDELPGGGLHTGVLVRNSQLAALPGVRERCPMLSQAILMGASAQLRNMAATVGIVTFGFTSLLQHGRVSLTTPGGVSGRCHGLLQVH